MKKINKLILFILFLLMPIFSIHAYEEAYNEEYLIDPFEGIAEEKEVDMTELLNTPKKLSERDENRIAIIIMTITLSITGLVIVVNKNSLSKM